MATTQTVIALNQFVNSLLTGNAYTTLSTKAYLSRKKNGSCKFADFLDIIFTQHKKYGGHCRYAFYTDMCRWESLLSTKGEDIFKLDVDTAIKENRYD